MHTHTCKQTPQGQPKQRRSPGAPSLPSLHQKDCFFNQAVTYLGFFFSVFTKNSCKSIPVESVYSWLESETTTAVEQMNKMLRYDFGSNEVYLSAVTQCTQEKLGGCQGEGPGSPRKETSSLKPVQSTFRIGHAVTGGPASAAPYFGINKQWLHLSSRRLSKQRAPWLCSASFLTPFEF